MSGDSALPEWLGDYRVAQLIHKGTMAEVYKGFSREGRAVAIKVLDASLKSDQDAIARFGREAEALKKIRHINVAELIDYGTTPDQRPYLVCELVNGPTLKAIIDRRDRPDLLKGLDWMEEAAEALREAWHHHIIHRDIKPENLMISEEGQLKVVDFGLAKAVFSEAAPGQGRKILGTPRYMSPEMILGQSLDLRSDMYSLGATFFHFFTGESPFEAETHEEMMQRHAGNVPPPPHAIEPGLPEDICYILTRLMAKDPSARYESYDDLIDHLRKTRLALMSREGLLGAASYEPPGEEAYTPKARPGETLDEPRRISPIEIAAEKDRRRRAAEAQIRDKREGSRFSAAFVILFSIAALGAFLFITFSAPAPQGGTRFQQAFDKLLTALGMPSTRSETDPQDWEEQDYLAIEANMTRMQDVMSILVTHRTEQGGFPETLEELVSTAELSEGDLSDAWGRPFVFMPATGMLYSYGADGAQYTDDDFQLDESLNFVQKPRRAVGD